MSPKDLLQQYLDECPLVAIIRGVTPDEADAIGQAIFDGGIRIIEVPLNSPEPLQSIERLAKRFGDRALFGHGRSDRLADRVPHRQGGDRVSSRWRRA